MVRTDDTLAAPAAGEQPGATVTAAVGESPDTAIVAAHEDQRSRRAVVTTKITRLGKLFDATYELPVPAEQTVDFALEKGAVGITAGWQSRRLSQRLAQVAVGFGSEQIVEHAQRQMVSARPGTTQPVCTSITGKSARSTMLSAMLRKKKRVTPTRPRVVIATMWAPHSLA